MPIELTTPVGRLVQGDLFKMQQKRDQFGQPKKKEDGTPDMQYYIGLAIEKTHPEWPAFWQALEAEARQSFPHFFPPNGTGNCVKQDFAWKIIDGDGFDSEGKPFAEREGFRGCWIVRMSTTFPIRTYYPGRYADADIVKNPELCPRGFYVRTRLNIKGNSNAQKPGLYVNPSMVEIAFEGERIVSGPDAGTAFGGQPAQQGYTPQGARAIGSGPQPGAAGPGAGPGAQPGYAMPPGAAAGPGTAMPTPQPQHAPMAQQQPAGFAPPPGSFGGPGAAMPNVAGAAMPGMPAQGMPAGVQPNHGFVAGAINPGYAPAAAPAGGPGMAPNAAPGMAAGPARFAPGAGVAHAPAMTGSPMPPQAAQPILMPGPNSQGYSLDQWRATGYNDQQMIAQGIAVVQ